MTRSVFSPMEDTYGTDFAAINGQNITFGFVLLDSCPPYCCFLVSTELRGRIL